MEQSSSFAQHQSFQLYLLRWEFQLDKLPQHDGEKEKKCGKIEIYSDEPVFSFPTSSPSAKSPIASKSSGILIAQGKPESRMRGNSESDAVLSSQARLKDAWNWEWRKCDRETGCL